VTRQLNRGPAWPLSSRLTPAPAPAVLRPVLYAIVCGSPVARHVGRLVALAHRAGWEVAVVTTPEGEKFIDGSALSEQTGHPVRSQFKHPADPDVLPAADAIVVAPATVNTVNKWACGIADTLALGLLIEGHGLGLPIVAMPYTNTAMAAHPAFRESLGRLRSWGVRVLFGDDVMALPPPGAGSRFAVHFPWQLPLAVLGPPRRAPSSPESGSRDAGVELAVRHRPRPTTGAGRPSPPRAPRPAPAIVRR
jgi:hypothetical protein